MKILQTPEAERWITTLETTTKMQGRGVLQNKCGMLCCLGLGLDILNPNEWHTYDDGTFYWWSKLTKYSMPQCQLEIFDIKPYVENLLISLNDVVKLNFKEIALVLRVLRETDISLSQINKVKYRANEGHIKTVISVIKSILEEV
jgi:hypothetical protein